MEGQNVEQYMHSVAIRRKDFTRGKTTVANFWLLDFLNDSTVQYTLEPGNATIEFRLDEDIGKNYFRWMIYTVLEKKIPKKNVKELEALKQELHYVMTGDMSHVKER